MALPSGASDMETLVLSGTSGGLSLGAIGSATFGGTLTTPGAMLYLGGGGGTLYVTSNISGNQSLVVGNQGIAGGSVVTSGMNTYTGDATVSSGTLQIPGGQVPAANEYVGINGAATFVQSGGTNAVSSAGSSVPRIQRRRQRHVRPEWQRPALRTQ